MSANVLSLNFRDNEVLFSPKEIKGGGDKVSKSYRSDIDVNIYGADTESVHYKDANGLIYEPQCSTFSDTDGEHIIWHSPEAKAFNDLFEFFLKQYAEKEFSNGNKKCIIYYHNLAYDWLQLIKQLGDLLTMSKTGMYKANKYRDLDKSDPKEDRDYFLGKFNQYYIYLRDRALFVGSAPHFTFRICKTEKVFIDVTFLDTFSFFKGSLDSVAKELKLGITKMERQEDLGRIDYRLISDDNERKIEFVKYALLDAKITRLAGEAIREIHKMADMKKFRVSSPSFAVQMLFKQLPEKKTVLNGIDDNKIMQLVLDTYRGGRTGGIVHGRVKDISVLDFASSYPTAMLSIPSFSPSMKYILVAAEMLEDTNGILEEIERNPNCFVRISGEESDTLYPSIIANNKVTKKLTPITGVFHNIATTGYELLCGVKSGTLTIHGFHEVVFLVESEKNPPFPFRDFARTAYKGKQEAAKGSILYTMWKLVLNGAYGKLIESRKRVIVSVEHEEDLIPYLKGKKEEFSIMFYDEYIRCMRDGENWDEKYKQLNADVLESCPIEELEFCSFSDIDIGGKDFGSYAVPAAASLITGIARARLRALMKCTNALYWDTDSVFIENLDLSKVQQQLLVGNKWLTSNVVPLQLGENLGDIDCELENGTGYLAGTKRYYISKDTGKLDDDGKPIIKIKKAIHGLPALPKDEIERMIMYLATDKGNGKYTTKQRPLKAKEAKSNRLIGSFEETEKQIHALYHRDDRLNWTYDNKMKRYNGTVRKWFSLI